MWQKHLIHRLELVWPNNSCVKTIVMYHVAQLICIHLYLNFLPEEIVSVIEARKVLELTQQFYWGLRTIAVQLRHIQVIHKDD